MGSNFGTVEAVDLSAKAATPPAVAMARDIATNVVAIGTLSEEDEAASGVVAVALEPDISAAGFEAALFAMAVVLNRIRRRMGVDTS